MSFDSNSTEQSATVSTSDSTSSVGGSDSGVAVSDSISPKKLIASFPKLKLDSLTQQISKPQWVVPVRPDGELQILLNAAIALTKAGVDHECEPCVEFYRNALTTSFKKILTDEYVNSRIYTIQHSILMCCDKLLHLIAIHMTRDNPYLLDLLAIVFDPDNKFITLHAGRHPECFQHPDHVWGMLDSNKMFAKPPPEPKSPRGWLVDMINHFGNLNGFENLLERFNIGLALLKKQQDQESDSSLGLDVAMTCKTSKSSIPSLSTTASGSLNEQGQQDNRLTLALIYSLLRPFGLCYELLTPATIAKYFMPIWSVVPDLLDSFSDDELKREAKPEGCNDYINGIVKAAKLLASRLPGQEDLIRDLEMFRLKKILRLLQVSSFNGKMNALNDINKVLTSVSYYSHQTLRMAEWIKKSDVLGTVLKNSLHQPQYVEELEKIIRFLIKEHALTLEDLDAVWRAQAGKHEDIVENVHDLLAKLAWDFTPEQLDHLFESFQTSMTTANKRQFERLLELIRRLAEDVQNGVMAQKILKLFWTLAHSQEVPPEVLDQALAAHVKILKHSSLQERHAQKIVWLDKCVAELKAGDNWVLPALRLIREICCLYESTPEQVPRTHQILNRQQVIDRLQHEHSLLVLVTNSLTSYMDKVRITLAETPNIEPNKLCIDGRYPHNLQIKERLDFLKFLLKDGELWLCADQAKQIWQCLAVNAVFPTDREECFLWFGELMGEEPDLDPRINKGFFENNIMQLDPQLMTESGIKCFERFFKAVNSKEYKLKAKHPDYILDNEDLVGKDYLWRVITTGNEEIVNKAIDLLKEVSTALVPRLQANVANFHEMFITECCERLHTHYYNVMVTMSDGSTNRENEKDQNPTTTPPDSMRSIEAEKMCRILKVLQEYIDEFDRSFDGDRSLLPLSLATMKMLQLMCRNAMLQNFAAGNGSNLKDTTDTINFNTNNADQTQISTDKKILQEMSEDISKKLEIPTKRWKDYTSKELRLYCARNVNKCDCSFVMKAEDGREIVYESFQWILCEVSSVFKEILNEKNNQSQNCKLIPIDFDPAFEAIIEYGFTKKVRVENYMKLCPLAFCESFLKYEVDIDEDALKKMFKDLTLEFDWVDLFHKTYIINRGNERWQRFFQCAKGALPFDEFEHQLQLEENVDKIMEFDIDAFDKFADIIAAEPISPFAIFFTIERNLIKHIFNGEPPKSYEEMNPLQKFVTDSFMIKLKYYDYSIYVENSPFVPPEAKQSSRKFEEWISILKKYYQDADN